MSALEQAKKMSREEVLEKIAASGILEYGIYREPVAERWKRVLREKEESEPIKVVSALNNADTKGALLPLLEQHIEEVLAGMEIAAYALGAAEMILYVPEYATELAKKIQPQAFGHGVSIVVGMPDIRENRMHSLNHIVTMKQIADCVNGSYEDGIYLSVNGGELKKYPGSTRIGDIAGAQEVKAFEIGYQFYPAAVAEKTLQEVLVPNGIFNLLTEENCMIHETLERLFASRKRSCGKCVFCREGLIQLHGMVKDIADGRGKNEYPDIMKEIGSAMVFSTPCSLGQESAKAALSSMEYCAQEYEEHIRKKHCAANVCSSFLTIYIDPLACEGCEECKDVCPVDCIEGKKGFIHMIDEFECTKCGKCMEACTYEAIVQTLGRVPKLPDRLIKCGKFKKH